MPFSDHQLKFIRPPILFKHVGILEMPMLFIYDINKHRTKNMNRLKRGSLMVYALFLHGYNRRRYNYRKFAIKKINFLSVRRFNEKFMLFNIVCSGGV